MVLNKEQTKEFIKFVTELRKLELSGDYLEKVINKWFDSHNIRYTK